MTLDDSVLRGDDNVSYKDDVPHRDDPYTPSAKDAPNGPRNNKDELGEIDRRTAEFAGSPREERFSTDAPVDEETQDPFSKDNAPAFTLITLMRIYDVQMALLNETSPEVATRLHEAHREGRLIGSFPWIDAEVDDE